MAVSGDPGMVANHRPEIYRRTFNCFALFGAVICLLATASSLMINESDLYWGYYQISSIRSISYFQLALSSRI